MVFCSNSVVLNKNCLQILGSFGVNQGRCASNKKQSCNSYIKGEMVSD